MSGHELQQLETLLVRALPDPRGFVDRVLEQLLDRLSRGNDAQRTIVGSTRPLGTRDLLERNTLVAAALGACECWGHDDKCEACFGHGIPGWEAPDEALYDEYVRPAAARRDARQET